LIKAGNGLDPPSHSSPRACPSTQYLITNETPQDHGLSHRRGHTGAVSTTAGVRIMAKSRIRFRKGWGLHNCLAPYGTEEQCADALFGWRWPAGFVCPQCGHAEEFTALRTREPMQCRHCRRRTSLTAGTIFA
jgi:hypothetical protein